MVPLTKPVTLEDGIELMVVRRRRHDSARRRMGGGQRDSAPRRQSGTCRFLAEAESSEIDTIVARVVDRSYTVEERFTIDVTLRDCKTFKSEWSSYAINEVSIEKAAGADARGAGGGGRSAAFAMGLRRDARFDTHRLDRAFSAGGPVIWPGVDALVVPLSAHALFARPLVLSPTSTVVVEVLDASPTHGVVWCDGRRSVELHAGMEIEVTRGKQAAALGPAVAGALHRPVGPKVRSQRGGLARSADPAITMIDTPA